VEERQPDKLAALTLVVRRLRRGSSDRFFAVAFDHLLMLTYLAGAWRRA